MCFAFCTVVAQLTRSGPGVVRCCLGHMRSSHSRYPHCVVVDTPKGVAHWAESACPEARRRVRAWTTPKAAADARFYKRCTCYGEGLLLERDVAEGRAFWHAGSEAAGVGRWCALAMVPSFSLRC